MDELNVVLARDHSFLQLYSVVGGYWAAFSFAHYEHPNTFDGK